MTFPDKDQRKICWDSRDKYWACLDEQNVQDSSAKPEACSKLRKIFEQSCRASWVKHFDGKRDFQKVQNMINNGSEPVKQNK